MIFTGNMMEDASGKDYILTGVFDGNNLTFNQ